MLNNFKKLSQKTQKETLMTAENDHTEKNE